MDSVPYYFARTVVAHQKSPVDIEQLGGVWASAAVEEGDSRFHCELHLISTTDPNVWLYNFACLSDEFKKALTIQQVKERNLAHLRVSKITLTRFSFPPGTFHEVSERELISELLPFACRYLTCGQGLNLNTAEIPSHPDVERAIFRTASSLINLRDVSLSYVGAQSHEFLLELLKMEHLEILVLRYNWPVDNIRLMLETWPNTHLKKVYTRVCSTTLDIVLLKQIYELWLRGFFVTRLFDGHFSSDLGPAQLDDLLGEGVKPSWCSPNVFKVWCSQHPLRGTFQVTRSSYSYSGYTTIRISA
uniref:FBA_2 domain-containing protein n=1 Tax=Steinernema glaseri TaxID=37863 RepID=A0A1I8AE79_9BILA